MDKGKRLAVIALVAASFTVACDGEPISQAPSTNVASPETAGSPANPEVVFPRQPPSSRPSVYGGQAAAVRGELVHDEMGCQRVKGPDGYAVVPVWPE
ncbi:MAG: hypothetical protein M3R38_12615 [Actinomycetota bacterium]|nr:hypothetical protein [Actinomycetota bacterium]